MSKNGAVAGASATEAVFAALDGFRIEVPSWGSPTRERGSASLRKRARRRLWRRSFSDAGRGEQADGASRRVAAACAVGPAQRQRRRSGAERLEKKYGVKSGAVNPNLFQSQEYKYGSIAHPSAEIRGHALAHLLDSVEIGKALETRMCRSGWPMDRTIRDAVDAQAD